MHKNQLIMDSEIKDILTPKVVNSILDTLRNGNVTEFSSHDFIFLLIYRNHEVYDNLMDKYNGNEQTVDAQIANHLRIYYADKGELRQTGESESINVRGNKTICKVWSF